MPLLIANRMGKTTFLLRPRTRVGGSLVWTRICFAQTSKMLERLMIVISTLKRERSKRRVQDHSVIHGEFKCSQGSFFKINLY